MKHPPKGIDLLITEGTNLGASKPAVSETDLENWLVERSKTVTGRIFVSWSGQNFDRLTTLYRVAKRTRRDLVIDLYTADMPEQVAEGSGLPRPGWPNLKVVLTAVFTPTATAKATAAATAAPASAPPRWPAAAPS